MAGSLHSIKKTKRMLRVLLLILVIISLIYVMFPIVWMFVTSIKSNSEIFAVPQTFIPRQGTTEAYNTVFHSSTRLRFFLNSFIVSSAVTIATLVVSILAGYAFSRYEFPGKKLVNMFVINTQAVPPIALMIPFFGMIVALKIYDTLWALILTSRVFTLPYGILMMTGYFNSIPKALDEAVKVDGGGPFRICWQFLVPISLPGIVATGVYTFIMTWNEYLYALTLTKSTEMRTVPVGIQLLMGEHAYVWNEMMAMSVLGSIPVLLIFLCCPKYFLAGMTAGAVKS